MRIEVILNSRLLIPVSTDLCDLSVLTQQVSLLAILYVYYLTGTQPSFLKTTYLDGDDWHRFRARSNYKSAVSGPDHAVRAPGWYSSDNLSSFQWSIGRVISTYRGTGNHVRMATIKKGKGEFKQTVQNLCPLPF